MKTRGALQGRQYMCSSTSGGSNAALAPFPLAYRTKSSSSGERAWRLRLALATATSAAAAAAAASFAGDGSGGRPAVNAAAATALRGGVEGGGDISSWSAEETSAFVAALREAVGEEHVSTDEGE